VVELWSARTSALGSRDDVAYVFVFENRGRMIGSTIDHPHSQVMAFGLIPPISKAELSASTCDLCQDPGDDLIVTRRCGWQAVVPWAPRSSARACSLIPSIRSRRRPSGEWLRRYTPVRDSRHDA